MRTSRSAHPASPAAYLLQRAKRLRAMGSGAVPADGLALARAAFGAVLAFYCARFVVRGWVGSFYVEPSFHFTYDAATWVRVPPAPLLYAVFAWMFVCACCLALGYRGRASAFGFGLAFTYVELLDKAAYLNHYYLVSLVCLLLTVLPSGDGAVGPWRWSSRAGDVPLLSYWALRAQLCIVYTFAGVAKLNTDWLLRGEPLLTWLQPYLSALAVDDPRVSRLLAVGLSWSAALFDLSIGLWLWLTRTRRFAFLAVCVFHGAIALLFPVGAFSWVMLALDLAFFGPRLRGQQPQLPSEPPKSGAAQAPFDLGRWVFVCTWLAIQVAVPLRAFLYPGNPNWSEDGFRFAWRVMLTEKAGSARFCIVSPSRHSAVWADTSELTRLQTQQMSTQPDMIHEYALHLAERRRKAGVSDVQVYVDSWAALNGRPSHRLVRGDVDLAGLPRGTPGWRFVSSLQEDSATSVGQSQCGIGALKK